MRCRFHRDSVRVALRERRTGSSSVPARSVPAGRSTAAPCLDQRRCGTSTEHRRNRQASGLPVDVPLSAKRTTERSTRTRDCPPGMSARCGTNRCAPTPSSSPNSREPRRSPPLSISWRQYAIGSGSVRRGAPETSGIDFGEYFADDLGHLMGGNRVIAFGLSDFFGETLHRRVAADEHMP